MPYPPILRKPSPTMTEPLKKKAKKAAEAEEEEEEETLQDDPYAPKQIASLAQDALVETAIEKVLSLLLRHIQHLLLCCL